MNNDTVTISYGNNFAPYDAKGIYQSTTTTFVWQKNNANVYDFSEDRRASLFVAPRSGTYSFQISLVQSNSGACKFGFGKSVSEIAVVHSPMTSNTNWNVTVELNEGDTLYAYPYLGGAAYSNITLYRRQYYADIPFSYGVNFTLQETGIYGVSSQLKQLGDLGVITILGVINKDFFLGQETTEHTTGNITPGNCVGFLQLGKYKIPYYL